MKPMCRMFAAVLLAIHALSAATAAGVATQDSSGPSRSLPGAADLFARHVAAVGGAEHLRSTTSLHTVARFESGPGVTGRLETWIAQPDRMVARLTIDGIGRVDTGLQGNVGWMIHPATGPKLLDGMALHQLRQQADLHLDLEPMRYLERAETVARRVHAGRDSYEVRLKATWGEEYTQYYDATDGWLIGVVRRLATPMGDVDTVTTFADYRDIGGVRRALRTTQQVGPMEQVFILEHVDTGQVDPTIFQLPRAIDALIRTRR